MKSLPADNNGLHCPTSCSALLLSPSLCNKTRHCRQHSGLALPSRKFLGQEAKRSCQYGIAEEQSCESGWGLKQRGRRDLRVPFGKLFLEIRNNVEEKACSVSSGAMTVKLNSRSSLYNSYISLPDPTQALEYKSCSYEDQSFMTQKSPFRE